MVTAPIALGVTERELAALLPDATPSEVLKLLAQIHRDHAVYPSSSVRRLVADQAQARLRFERLVLNQTLASQVDPFVKYGLVAADGRLIETVRIPLEAAGRYSVCVSSQVGCALACAFCATGRMGLVRNLAAWEIVDQVRHVRDGLTAGRVHGVVFQGMGEPLANLDHVLTAIQILTHPCSPGIDARNITVCTSGLPAGIRRLAQAAPRVRLGLSIGSARPDVRASLMPIAKAHAWEDVMAAVREHALATGHAPMWAVALLRDRNDSAEDAEALAACALKFWQDTGIRPRLTIIPYNPISEAAEAEPFLPSTPEAEARFRAILASAGLPHHKRYSGGGDVGAACGQLAHDARQS